MNFKKALNVAARSIVPNRPYHVQWMITRKCNYQCKGCNVWQEQKKGELSTEEIKRGLNILKSLGVVEIVLSGGNPLLREDIKEIIEYSSNLFVTTVYDNGSMAVKKIDALRKADFVAISIDSLDPKKNDYIKGVNGAWEKAIQALERLHSEGVNVSVTPTISQFNLYEILNMTTYFSQKGIPLWFCLYSYDSSSDERQLFRIGKKNDEFVITDKQTIIKICDSLTEMKKRNTNILMTDKTLEAVKQFYLDGTRIWDCQALQNFLIVDDLGRIAGCHMHNFIASIFDLPKVWTSKKFNALRKTYRKCTQCTYLCYIFYSIHGSPRGNLEIAQEQWKNARFLLKKK